MKLQLITHSYLAYVKENKEILKGMRKRTSNVLMLHGMLYFIHNLFSF